MHAAKHDRLVFDEERAALPPAYPAGWTPPLPPEEEDDDEKNPNKPDAFGFT
jgi:hypothetical protein